MEIKNEIFAENLLSNGWILFSFHFQYTIENFCSIFKILFTLHIFISNLSQIIEHNTQQLLQ